MGYITSGYPDPITGTEGAEFDNEKLKEVVLNLFSSYMNMLNEYNSTVDRVPGSWVLGDLSHATVEAQNITTRKRRIISSQIANLIADKIEAGTLDLSKGISITDGSSGTMLITQDSISINVDGRTRLFAGLDPNAGKFSFYIMNSDGSQGIGMDEDGGAVFSGTVTGGEIISKTKIKVTEDVQIGRNLTLIGEGDHTIVIGTSASMSNRSATNTFEIRGQQGIDIFSSSGTIKLRCGGAELAISDSGVTINGNAVSVQSE